MLVSIRVVLAAAGTLLATAAAAQKRLVNDAVLLPEAQVELPVAGPDYVLVGFGLAAPTRDAGSTFASGQLRLGYEHFGAGPWSGGATLRLLGGPEQGFGDFLGLGGNFAPGVFGRHRSTLGGFAVGQRLGLEYAATLGGQGSTDRDRGLARLRLDAERTFAVGPKLGLRPRLAYELAAYLRLLRNANDPAERVIDFGSLRAEVGLRLSPRLDLTPWAASQTRFITSLPQYNSSGAQVGGGRTNLLTPVLGLDVRLTLGGAEGLAERKPLPTQH